MAPAKSQKSKITRMYDRLGRLYGKRRRITCGTLFEQLIVTILSSEAKEPQAFKALSLLQEEYVDWNEVRICSEDTLRSDLKKAGVNSGAPLLLKNALDGILVETCTLEPEFFEDQPLSDVRDLLERIRFPKSLTASLLLSRGPVPKKLNVPVGPGVARVMSRTGFVNTSRATNEIRRQVAGLLPEKEAHNFYRVVGRLAHDFCRNDSPNCSKCPIRSECIHNEANAVPTNSATAQRAESVRVKVASRRSRPPSTDTHAGEAQTA